MQSVKRSLRIITAAALAASAIAAVASLLLLARAEQPDWGVPVLLALYAAPAGAAAGAAFVALRWIWSD